MNINQNINKNDDYIDYIHFQMHIMWYESLMINETLDSVKSAAEKSPLPVKFTICLNSQTYIETPINGNADDMFSIFMNHPIIKQSTLVYKTNEDPFYNIGDWRRDIYDTNAKYTIWGESDCLVPDEFFIILANLKMDTPHIISFSSRKCWDHSWKIVEHAELKNLTPVDKQNPELLEDISPLRYFDRITQSELNDFNKKYNDIIIEKLPSVKIDGSLLVLSKNLPNPFIPKNMHFVREDTCAGAFFELNGIPQFHVSNKIKGHNYFHENKRTNTNASRNDALYLDMESKSLNAMSVFLNSEYLKHKLDITFVLAVYNKLDLTKRCYERIRQLYPNIPITISSGGSTDGTVEWLQSLDDLNLKYTHSDEKLVFSKNYNIAIQMADTSRVVLIHNDMVIGKYFLENIHKSLTEDVILTYTTVEPPIFVNHTRAGKVIKDFGYSFDDFNWDEFDLYVEEQKNKCELYTGSFFFMAAYKSLFENVGFFDDFTFFPAFAEDDDFLIRAKLKGYKLITTSCAVTYHFVSQTSRFSEDFKNQREIYENNSNRNFVRKWGMTVNGFNQLQYWNVDNFKYEKPKIELVLSDASLISTLEPFFDKITLENENRVEIYKQYIETEAKNTNYNLSKKFDTNEVMDARVHLTGKITQEEAMVLQMLPLVIQAYTPGQYSAGSLFLYIY
jgi:GT2 family glycosyltransferase